jgi:hypothetical protein
MTAAVDIAPDDEALLETGVYAPPPPAPAADRVMLIACGAVAREVIAVIRLNGWTHMDLECLPAKLHNRPERIPEALRAKARAARARGYGRVVAVYGDCGTGGGVDAICVEEGMERIPGPHCYAFFDGVDAFAARAEVEIGAFYLTDFLARHFEALVWRGLGLDRHPELIEMMFGHYDRLVYLAQTDDRSLDQAALRAALALGLRFERRFTGYGDLAATLARAAV